MLHANQARLQSIECIALIPNEAVAPQREVKQPNFSAHQPFGISQGFRGRSHGEAGLQESFGSWAVSVSVVAPTSNRGERWTSKCLMLWSVLVCAGSCSTTSPHRGSPMTAQGNALGYRGTKIAKPQRGGPNVSLGLSVSVAPLRRGTEPKSTPHCPFDAQTIRGRGERPNGSRDYARSFLPTCLTPNG